MLTPNASSENGNGFGDFLQGGIFFAVEIVVGAGRPGGGAIAEVDDDEVPSPGASGGNEVSGEAFEDFAGPRLSPACAIGIGAGIPGIPPGGAIAVLFDLAVDRLGFQRQPGPRVWGSPEMVPHLQRSHVQNAE